MSPATSRQYPKTATGLAVAALVSIVLAFYQGLWLPGLVLIKRDAFRYFLPLKQYLIERLSAGELPQWFPYEALGRPFIGATVTGVFHPFTALYFFFSVPEAYRVSTLLSCLGAALGAFALGRRLGFSFVGALLAGVTFALSGYVVSLTENLLFLYSICMLPLFCVVLEKAVRDNTVWVVAPAAIWATVFLIGDVQTGYYYAFIALLWVLARTTRSWQETGFRLVLIGALTALLAWVQLGPSWVTFAGSERARPDAFIEQALRWSTHPLRLATMFLSPVFEGTPLRSALDVFFATQQKSSELQGGFWTESLYLGVPIMGLAFLGAWHRRDLRVLALLGGLAVLLSLGRYGVLYEIFYRIMPLWSAFRYPEKLMGVVAFVTAMLAGAGLDALRAHKRQHLVFWLAVASFCAITGLCVLTDTAKAWVATRLQIPEILAQTLTNSTGLAFLYSAAVTLGLWFTLAAARHGYLSITVTLSLLTAIVTFDLFNANGGAYHTASGKAATFIPAFVKTLKELEGPLKPGRFRLVSTTELETIWSDRLEHRLGYHGAVSTARRQALALEHNAEFHLETTPPLLPGYNTALFSILGQEPSREVEARFNVVYYIGRRRYLNEQRIAKQLVSELPYFDLALFRNPLPVKPRAYLSQQPERTAAPVDPAALLARSDFLSGDVDVIETSDTTLPEPVTNGSVTIERYAPEHVNVRVETTKPAVLILLDSFDAGWLATLEDGNALPIMRANALVRAVVVPAGGHVVTFRYTTPFLGAGAAASLAGAVICLVMIAQARRRTHRARGLP